jgi:hypothetical protein
MSNKVICDGSVRLRITVLVDGVPIRMEVFDLNGVHQVVAETLASHISVNATMPTFINVIVERIEP